MINSTNHQTKITIITILHSKKIHFTQNQRINAIFQDSNSRKRQKTSARTPLSQRYNNVWMNGGAVPSSEADSRAFSFDIIPSSQIDNLTIVKPPTAEYPADYSGGFIIVNTKEIPAENSFNITVGGFKR